MAIDFTTGTINEPDAGSVGLSMVEQIRDDVAAHPAWELVEEYTPGGGAVKWTVLKCLATESGLVDDFYIVMGRTLGSGKLTFFVCEGYDAGTHTASFYATSQNGSAVTYDSEGRAPLATFTYPLGTVELFGSPTTPRSSTWAPSGVSTKWWITVSEDGFTVAFNGASNGFVHCGAFVPLSALDNPMPVHTYGSDNIGAHTRNPAVAGEADTGLALMSQFGPLLGFPGRLDVNDKLQEDQRPVAEQSLVIYMNQASERPQHGWALGKFKRMRVGQTGTTPVGVAFGDAYILEGRLWVPYLPSSEFLWDTGVAA